LIFGFFIAKSVAPKIKPASEYFGDFFQVLILHTFTEFIASATKIFIIQELGQTSVAVIFKQFEFLNQLKNICFSIIKSMKEAH
jgi:hypothetical protein